MDDMIYTHGFSDDLVLIIVMPTRQDQMDTVERDPIPVVAGARATVH